MEGFPSVTTVVGGFIEGIGIANMLYGISVSQAYVYYSQWDCEPKWMKCLAATVMLLETCNTVFIQRQQYFYSVLAIENPFLLLKIDWSIPTAVAFGMVLETLVQGFYVHRMWKFTRNIFLTVGTGFLLFCRYAFFLLLVVILYTSNTWQEYEDKIATRPALLTTGSLIVVSDIIIATTMGIYLYRRQSNLKRTQGIVTWLIMYSVSTGAILVAMSVCSLIAYLAQPKSLLYCAFIMLYDRALANAFFGALNARHLLHTKVDDSVTIGGTSYRSQGSAYHAAQELHKVRASAALNHQVHLQIHKDTEVVTDLENASRDGDNSVMVFKANHAFE